MMNLWKPTDHCRLERVEDGIQMQLRSGWAPFRCQPILLRRADHPLLLADVPYAWGGWGILAYIDEKQYYVQSDCAGEGQFLYDLSALLDLCGREQATVILAPFITTGAGAKVTFRDLTILGNAQ